MENTTINLDQLTKPLETDGSLVTAAIERFNTVFGGRWSFKIIEHQVRDSEVIVLGELAADGTARQQFGKAMITFDTDPSSTPSLADHLAKAADDALVRCAYAFGIARNTEKKQPDNPKPQSTPAEPPSNGNGNGGRKLTNRQLAAIFGLGKGSGKTQQEVIGMATGCYGREPAALTVTEASELISKLKNNNGKE